MKSARPFLVHETVDNTHKKSGALNQAWALTRGDTDLFICIDADTVLPPGALRDWEAEFIQDDEIAGCSAKFTMLSAQEMSGLAKDSIVPMTAGEFPALSFRERMWCRIQKAEFAKWTDTALARKGRWTSVLAGTACVHPRLGARRGRGAQRGSKAGRRRPNAPWVYTSEVEDFELTYRLRELGYVCRVSADVRAYTGAMLTLRTLWAQRLKWQVGPSRELRRIGVNRLTSSTGGSSSSAWSRLSFACRGWHSSCSPSPVSGHVHLLRFWWIFPVVFVVCDVREAWRMPHRTKADLLTSALLFPRRPSPGSGRHGSHGHGWRC